MHAVGRKSSVGNAISSLVNSFRGGFGSTDTRAGTVHRNRGVARTSSEDLVVRNESESESEDGNENENTNMKTDLNAGAYGKNNTDINDSRSQILTHQDGILSLLNSDIANNCAKRASTVKHAAYMDVAISAEIVDSVPVASSRQGTQLETAPVPEPVQALRDSEGQGVSNGNSRSSSIGGHSRFNVQAYDRNLMTSPTMANVNSNPSGLFAGRRSVTLLSQRIGSSAGTEEESIGSDESEANAGNAANINAERDDSESERHTQNEGIIEEVDESRANEQTSSDECHTSNACNEESEPVQEISVSSRDSHSATPSASNPVSASTNEQSTASAVVHGAAVTAETTPATEPGEENTNGRKKMDAEGYYSIRLTPFIDHASSAPYMFFGPVIRRLKPGMKIAVGRYTEKCRSAATAPQGSSAPVVFKSKVVSRHHAELSVDEDGVWYIKDVSSSSGTFLNHVRLSLANVESGEYNLGDSDILQFGMDYRGGSEEIYRCVKVKVELNFSWRRRGAKFSKEAHERLKELTLTRKDEDLPSCVICLGPIKPCQAVFVASCSHSWHYKCIRPLIVKNYPQFMCPNCKAICDIEADLDDEDGI